MWLRYPPLPFLYLKHVDLQCFHSVFWPDLRNYAGLYLKNGRRFCSCQFKDFCEKNVRQDTCEKKYGCQPKNRGVKPPKSSHLFIGFSIIFTIHFRCLPPIFGNTHILEMFDRFQILAQDNQEFILGDKKKMLS